MSEQPTPTEQMLSDAAVVAVVTDTLNRLVILSAENAKLRLGKIVPCAYCSGTGRTYPEGHQHYHHSCPSCKGAGAQRV